MKTTYEPERGAARKPASSFLDLVDDDSCDWRQLALGMAALLGQSPPSNNEDLLTDVARQLTSPVATLRAQAARLEEAATSSPAEDARELAARIAEQADHVAEWVDAILDVERLRLGKARLELRKTDLVELALDAVTELQTTTPRVDVRVAARQSMFVEVDGPRLSRVMRTLVRSTAKHAAGKPIEISVAPAEHTSPARWAAVVVRETGPDVDAPGREAELDLDLVLAREIARFHGGDVSPTWRGGGVTLFVPGGQT